MAKKNRGLICIRGIHYARVRIPSLLVAAFGRKELKKSLGTRNLQEARKRLAAWLDQVQLLFNEVRMAELTKELAQKMAKQHLAASLEHQEDLRLTLGSLSDSTLEAIEAIHQVYHGLGKHALAHNRLDDVRALADQLLLEQQIPPGQVDRSGIPYLALSRSLLRHEVDYHSIELERLQGNYQNDYDRSLEQAASTAMPAILPRSMTSMNQFATGGPIAKLIDQYCRDNGKTWGEKTKKEMAFAFRLFKELAGEKDVRDYVFEDFLSFKEALTFLPAGVTRYNRYKGRGIKEVVAEVKQSLQEPAKKKRGHGAKPDHTLLELRTQSKQLERISWFFSWCVKKNLLLVNHASGLGYDKETEDSRPVRRFELEELQAIIDNLPIQSARPEQFFVPLFGLFNGMRMNEICQLYVHDIGYDKDTKLLCITITDDGESKLKLGQKTKTLSSRRKIPVHPLLIELGFERYFKEMITLQKRKGTKAAIQLWPNLNEGINGYVGGMSNWWRRFVDKKVTSDDQVDFRSLRKNFVNALDAKMITMDEYQPVIGHEVKSVTRRHYIEPKMQVLLNITQQVDYPSLDLARLIKNIPW